MGHGTVSHRAKIQMHVCINAKSKLLPSFQSALQQEGNIEVSGHEDQNRGTLVYLSGQGRILEERNVLERTPIMTPIMTTNL